MNTIENFGERFGRLGNQLFQLAALFAVEQRRGHGFFLPHAGETLWDCFALDLPAGGPAPRHRWVEEHGSCNYDATVFDQPDGTGFHGYFQTYRYLEGHEDAFRRLLRFDVRYRAKAEALRFTLGRRHGLPLVAVHVRRKDYVETGYAATWGDLAAAGYYARAVDLIGDDVTYVVFSDDIPWCRRSLGIEPAEFADLDAGTSLCLMSICDAVVLANSSFSWWGAYLNPAAQVFAPSRWFGPAMGPPNDRQDDILLPTWTTIPVRFGSGSPGPGERP